MRNFFFRGNRTRVAQHDKSRGLFPRRQRRRATAHVYLPKFSLCVALPKSGMHFPDTKKAHYEGCLLFDTEKLKRRVVYHKLGSLVTFLLDPVAKILCLCQ